MPQCPQCRSDRAVAGKFPPVYSGRYRTPLRFNPSNLSFWSTLVGDPPVVAEEACACPDCGLVWGAVSAVELANYVKQHGIKPGHQSMAKRAGGWLRKLTGGTKGQDPKDPVLSGSECDCPRKDGSGGVIAPPALSSETIAAPAAEKPITFRWRLLLIAVVLGLVTAMKLGHKCDLGVKWFETHSLWMFPLLYGVAVQMLRRRPAWLAAVVLCALFALATFVLVPWYLAAIHPHGGE